jgi:hypothetical protein
MENGKQHKIPRKGFYSPGPINPGNKMIKPSSLHTARTLLSLRAGNSSSTRRSTTTGTLVPSDCILLCKLTVDSSLMTVCTFNISAYKNSSDTTSKLGHDVSNVEYLPWSWKKSFYV